MAIYPIAASYFRENNISQAFGVADPHYKSGIHMGVDFPCPTGTIVVAPADGEITYRFIDNPSMGNAIYYRCVIDGTTYYMRFLHLSFTHAVGEYKMGDQIGLTGSTGDSTGPHLHHDVWLCPIATAVLMTKESVLKNLVDPLAFWKEKVDGITTQA